MKASRADLRSSVRALFGAWAGDRAAPLPAIPQDFPAEVAAVARDAVKVLAHYQGVAYARLYLHRLQRFVGRPGVDAVTFARIAQLMAERMAYRDPVRVAQLVLDDAQSGAAERRYVFRLDDLIEPLPDLLAVPLLTIVDWLGWRRTMITLRYFPHSFGGRARLRLEAGLRHWRSLGRSARRERVWVERWLHMIDRAVTLQPAAVPAIVETATLIQGHGEAYRQGLADWHLIIDRLAKPVFDAHLALPDLAGAIAAARAAAAPDPQQAQLKTVIASLCAGQPAFDSSVACIPQRAMS